MICLIDNYDSFTYNIVHLFNKINADIIVLKNNRSVEDIKKFNPTKIIISPGPGKPNESGNCFQIIDYFKDKLPILGICLGHQIIAEYFHSKISNAKCILHGKKTLIQHNDKGIFYNLPTQFYIARYHSLSIKKISNELEITAIDINDNEIMAIQHKKLAIFGIQFHPESFLSEQGQELFINFLKI